jgi:hypothetical protein
MADGNAGRQRWFPDVTVIWLPDGGWSIALPNSLIWPQAALWLRQQVVTLVAQSSDADIEQAGTFPEMTVGNALAAEAAHSNTTIARVFSHLRDNTFYNLRLTHAKKLRRYTVGGPSPVPNYDIFNSFVSI